MTSGLQNHLAYCIMQAAGSTSENRLVRLNYLNNKILSTYVLKSTYGTGQVVADGSVEEEASFVGPTPGYIPDRVASPSQHYHRYVELLHEIYTLSVLSD